MSGGQTPKCQAPYIWIWSSSVRVRWGAGERGVGREREKRLHSPFAVHAAIHQATLGVGDQGGGANPEMPSAPQLDLVVSRDPHDCPIIPGTFVWGWG